MNVRGWLGVLLVCSMWNTCAVARAQDGVLSLRGDLAAPAGAVVGVDAEGVTVESTVTGRTVVPWHLVRETPSEFVEEAAQFRTVADRLWRATSRLAREDMPASEPLFEELFVEYLGRQGPTAAAVCDGLFACRLRRGAHTLAVGAWLAGLHARAGVGPRWYALPSEGELVNSDDQTGLAPDLPPIWLDLPAVRVFGGGALDVTRFGPRERALAQFYQAAALHATGGAAPPLQRPSDADPGLRLVWEVVAAQSPVQSERVAGRRSIENRLRAPQAGWIDAWLRTALGRSLLREPSIEDRQRGVLELVRVRVLHEREAPYLSGVALAEAVVALSALGDDDAATLLRRELLDTFPGHPASAWERIVEWPSSGGSARAIPDINDRDLRNPNA